MIDISDLSSINKDKLTPAMKQFVHIKEQYPDYVLFFRMGDFYEMFYNDAKLCSKVLGITLTKRGDAPLAGVPYHQLEPNATKMLAAGHKIAICEQTEDPKTVKGRIVNRDVVRLVTPGTTLYQSMLDDQKNNYILAIANMQSSIEETASFGLAMCDLSTGEFMTTQLDTKEDVLHEIARFSPSEIVATKELQNIFDTVQTQDIFFTTPAQHTTTHSAAYKELTSHFNTQSLDGFSLEDKKEATVAAGILLSYLKETQRGAIDHISTLRLFSAKDYMTLDFTTLRNLEIFSTIRDNKASSSLFASLNKTVTSMGARMLQQWLQKPLLSHTDIQDRLDAVEELEHKTLLREELRDLLSSLYDIPRLITRVSNETANARDLNALKESLQKVPLIQQHVSSLQSSKLQSINALPDLQHIATLIQTAIRDDPPLSVREGNIIQASYNEDVKDLRKIAHNSSQWLQEYEAKVRKETNVQQLKVGYNRVHGYYVESSRKNESLMPAHFIRKQTLANNVRYTTEELQTFQDKVLGAQEKLQQKEYELFMQILHKVKEALVPIQETATALATLDVLVTFAQLAVQRTYVKPTMTTDYEMNISQARHPVVELLSSEPFVPNDTVLSKQTQMMLITGPNMAGKSTYMRQVALIQLLAQIGSFVPAASATLAVADRIFTRVGASDDLAAGQSTFMVEMHETAAILNSATTHSLIILDEIGRGTSTYDGLSLAWSIAEYIATQIGAKTLFATHYHQLNALHATYPMIQNFNIAVKELDDSIVFLRKIVQGGTDKSYGIHVAKLAGVPQQVIDRAKTIMGGFESQGDAIDTSDNEHTPKQENQKDAPSLNQWL